MRGQQISISSATIAAAVPQTTALRYIEALQRHPVSNSSIVSEAAQAIRASSSA